MTTFELLYFLREPLKELSKFDIKIGDVEHIAMYMEYKRLSTTNAKKDYIITKLVKKYHLSERTITRIVTRLSKDVKV